MIFIYAVLDKIKLIEQVFGIKVNSQHCDNPTKSLLDSDMAIFLDEHFNIQLFNLAIFNKMPVVVCELGKVGQFIDNFKKEYNGIY